MRLLNLHIRNFRKIEDLSLIFPKGLTVIVDENNVGKTAIIDALRLILFSSRDFEALRLNEDDFRRGSPRMHQSRFTAPFVISAIQTKFTFRSALWTLATGSFTRD